MKQTLSLAGIIQRALFPRLIAALLLISLSICTAVLYFAQKQMTERQEHYAAILKDDIQNSIQDAILQLRSVADNDIIVNSFIDYEQRDKYLPLFFRTLRLTHAPSFRLALYDFAAQPVITKNWDTPLPRRLQKLWQAQTLDEGQQTASISEQGVMLAVPVLLGDNVEGALVLYVDRIADLIYPRDNAAIQIVTGDNSSVLYSTDPAVLPTGEPLKEHTVNYWITHTVPFNDLTIRSLAPLRTVYESVFWLLPLLLCCIIGTILISVYAVRRSASLTGETLTSLHQSIAQSMNRQYLTKSIAPPDEAKELALIRLAFDKLTENLLSITLSNRQFSNVIDSLEELLVVLDTDDNVLIANRRYSDYAAQLNFSNENLSQLKRQIFENEGAIDKAYGGQANKTVTLKWDKLPFTDQHKNIIGNILVGNDVTEKRRLESMNRLMSHAMQSATVAIGIAEFNKQRLLITYINAYFTRLTGYNFADLANQPLSTLTGLETDVQKVKIIHRQLLAWESVDETLTLYKRNGSIFYTRLILTPVRYNNRVTHYVAFCQDITEQEQTRRYLIEAKSKAEESARLKSSFLASMSHEVRTPLHGVSGTLQLIDSSSLVSNQQYYLSLARQSLQNLQHIVDDILDFSKIEAGQLNIEHIAFDLPLLISTIIEHYKPSCEQKEINLSVVTDLNDVALVNGDPVRLRQILSNLLSNAVKFTANGQITAHFSLQEEANNWLFRGSIRDTGIGIEKDKLKSIFDVFTQEDSTTTRRYGGTGLGLAITRQLCNLLNGDIQVESQKGVGSTFRFTVSFEHAIEQKCKAPLPHPPPSNEKSSASLRILLVEDNKVNQVIARENLKRHKVMIADTGKDALSALRQVKKPFDLVLMDCQMPVMDGYEATRRIRAGDAGEIHQAVPVVALTANAMKGDREACINAGMTDYISKPFTAVDLDRVVQNIIVSASRLT